VRINPGYYTDAQLLVQSMERPELQYKPLSQGRGYIIVGLDPGTTTGIAALNLSGELVDLTSSRGLSSSEVIEWIAARGRSLVVATDVYPTPGSVEKVKRAFNAVLYSPGGDIPAEEKIALGKEFGYKNDHERDALAAAISAFKKYKNKFLLVEKKVPSEIDPDEVKALVVRGYSIENAIAELVPSSLAPARQKAQPQGAEKAVLDASLEVSPDVTALRLQNQQLAEQVRTLRSYLDELRADLAEKDAALRKANGKIDRLQDKTAREIKRAHEIKIRDKEIDRLRSVLRSERKHIKKLKKALVRQKKAEQIEETEGLLRLKPLQAFNREAVQLTAERYGLEEGDLVFLEDASGGGRSTAELLFEKQVAGVIANGEMVPAVLEHFMEMGLPVFSSKEVDVRMVNGLPFASPEDVAAASAAWEEMQKARRARLKAERLESLFQEYRVERKKEEKRKQKLGPAVKSDST